MGRVRFAILIFLLLLMFLLPLKMLLRWSFGLSYLVSIPEWSLNICNIAMSADEETFYNMKRLHAVFAFRPSLSWRPPRGRCRSDARRPWKQYQRTFHNHFDRKSAPRRPWQPRIEQISLPDLPAANRFRQLGRVDRCTTCHLGIDGAGGQRGDEPYLAHPRLDLFVGEDSPHPMSRFGCTACHEGQGGATDFAWAGHTPNDVEQEARWRRQYGWFRNPHWDWPMLPGRFVESRCLACHSEATDLEPTERFRDPPAARLHGRLSPRAATGLHGLPRNERRRFLGPRKLGPSLQALPKRWTPPTSRTASAIRRDFSPDAPYHACSAFTSTFPARRWPRRRGEKKWRFRASSNT